MCDFPVNIIAKGILRTSYREQLVPCGKCDACFKDRSEQWFLRIRHELKQATSAYFVTLTYADDPPRTDNGFLTVSKEHLKAYFKSLKQREPKSGIKYYASSEYGELQRPHYHAIILNVQNQLNLVRAWTITDNITKQSILRGIVDIRPVVDARIRYTTGYIGKRIGIPHFTGSELYDDRTPEFSLMSMGIGKSYIDYAKNFHQDNMQSYTYMDGFKHKLPRYYKEKIWPDMPFNAVDFLNSYAQLYGWSQTKILVKCNAIPNIWSLKKLTNEHRQLINTQAYAHFLEHQAKDVANFPSFDHWEENQRALAEARNPVKRRAFNPQL